MSDPKQALFFARRVALFLRTLSDEIVPTNKLAELIEQLASNEDRGWGSVSSDDFTKRERELAALLAPTPEEIDLAFEARLAEYAREITKLKESNDSLREMWRGDSDIIRHLNWKLGRYDAVCEKLGLAPEKIASGSGGEENKGMVKNTGVFVSDEHRNAAIDNARGAISTPLVKVLGKWLPDLERASFGDWIDALAQSYGLPPPAKNRDGEAVHYGMTMRGEFTRWEGNPDGCPDQDILGT